MLALVTVRAPSLQRSYVLAPGRLLVLGRADGCDLCVPETSVSRRHCTVLVLDGGVEVADLGAAHGVQRRGQKVERARLATGDSVLLGSAELALDGWIPAEAVAHRSELTDALATTGSAPLADGEGFALQRAASRAASAAVAPAAPRTAAVGGPGADGAAPAPPPASATSAPADGALPAGSVLGGYRIGALLGAGGFADVYRAEQIQLGREVALKVLRAAAADAPVDALPSFLREARAAAALADPRLVQVFDLGEADGRWYLSMELVRGGSLADALRRDGPAPWRALLPILRDVAGALQVAHRAGLVHRDVKPANILLTGDGRAKLADLGLVRDIGGAGDRLGTAAYMAPEQLAAGPIDRRVDVYALGCTAYHALSGQPPYQGSTKEILRRKRTEAPPPFDPALGVPAAVDQFVREQLLALAPQERPADAEAVLAELDRLERLGSAPVRRVAAAARRPRGGGAGPWLAVAIALALFALAYALWQRRPGG
jgi:serine/threonine-protein kinase